MDRRKIEMKMVNDQSSRQVTFSKHRTRLFKKANELAISCAAQIVIVLFFLGGKAFFLGNPIVHSIADHSLNKDDHQNKGNKVPRRARSTKKEVRIRKLNKQLNDLLKQVHDEEKRGERLKKALKAYKPIAELDFDELMMMKTKLEQLKNKLKGYRTELEVSSSSLLFPKNPNDHENDVD